MSNKQELMSKLDELTKEVEALKTRIDGVPGEETLSASDVPAGEAWIVEVEGTRVSAVRDLDGDWFTGRQQEVSRYCYPDSVVTLISRLVPETDTEECPGETSYGKFKVYVDFEDARWRYNFSEECWEYELENGAWCCRVLGEVEQGQLRYLGKRFDPIREAGDRAFDRTEKYMNEEGRNATFDFEEGSWYFEPRLAEPKQSLNEWLDKDEFVKVTDK